jgi:two-component system, chemotaxis family, protein-glutamate methylesterase/glutaminase
VGAKGEAPVRVLVVDDSAIVRDLLETGLSRRPGILVVGKASDAYSARDKIVFLKPDVLTLDIEMPKMDGIEFLRRLMPQYPLPVVVVSAHSSEGSRRALEAMDAGAIGIVAKPSGSGAEGLLTMLDELADSVLEASRADLSKARRGAGPRAAPAAARRKPEAGPGAPADRIIAIGASTGGTTALRAILPLLPEDSPGILIVQHMPAGFTRLFAESLDRDCRVRVKEACDGETVMRGTAYVAPGDFHLRLSGKPGAYSLSVFSGPKVNGHRPAVDVLFSSAAVCARGMAVGLVLTGMGKDGANGLLEMRRAGARCLAQDEDSSVVFGMPKEAFACGAAERLVPLDEAAAAAMAASRG